MSQSEIIRDVETERSRNPFLKVGNPGAFVPDFSSGTADRAAFEPTAPETASEQLSGQIGLMKISAEDRSLASDLVHCLDERGFLSDRPEEISVYLGVPVARIQAVVAKLQMLDPSGVFAWSLGDCFRIQLQAKNRFDPLIELLLDRLDLVANRDFDAICNLCKVDREDAEDMVDDIRLLSPSPLRQLEPLADIRRPDLIIKAPESGEPVAELNPDALPDLLTDDALFSELKTVDPEGVAATYYRDCYRDAAQLVAALQKRANTLLSIGNHLATVQRRFLETGRKLDRVPLSMSKTAEALGLHKSTVSRALSGCTIETGHGVLDATVFFIRRLNDDAQHRTRDQALKRLSLMIRTEDRRRPLSDAVLASMLAKSNFEISRRAVAKYRGLLGIPNSTKRKQRSSRRA